MKLACVLALSGVCLIGSSASARIISYAPLSSHLAVSAVASRTSRHVLLLELDTSGLWGEYRKGRLVLYDSTGQEERRVLLPDDGTSTWFTFAALFEQDGQPPVILVGKLASSFASPGQMRYLISSDGGRSFASVRLPDGTSTDWLSVPSVSAPDRGGPFVSSRRSNVRVGNRDLPFFVAFKDLGGSGRGGVYGVKPDGTTVLLFAHDVLSYMPCSLIGTDREAKRLLVAGVPAFPSVEERGLYVVSTTGAPARRLAFPWADPLGTDLEGWITPSGAAYLDLGLSSYDRRIAYVDGEAITDVFHLDPRGGGDLFAVPTDDYSGAWIAPSTSDQTGRGPTLYRHAPGSPPVLQFRAGETPVLSAVHTGAGDGRLLLVTSTRITTAEATIVDAGLAVWNPGSPAPSAWDELWINQTGISGFVHVDVDAVVSGADFLYSSGAITFTPPGETGGAPSGSGGSDVVQEWGVVRASLKQRLLIPRVERSANGATKTDLILRNPTASRLFVGFDFAPDGRSRSGAASLPGVLLEPGEIRVAEDFLKSSLGLDAASGALYLETPDLLAIEAIARIDTSTPSGSFAIGVPALELRTAATAGFPLSYAGALAGSAFRSDLVLVDATGRGAEATLHLDSQVPEAHPADVTLRAPAWGPVRLTDLASRLTGPGSLSVQPTSGALLPLFTLTDTRTGSSTSFPPDLSLRRSRIIPAIVHTDGAGGARYRTDLYLYNPTDETQTVQLHAKPWDTKVPGRTVPFTLLPHESQTIPDALATLFELNGVARLGFSNGYSSAPTSGLRIASRTYTVTPSGTYGVAIPPLNTFQQARIGDVLEILGSLVSPRFRTNLALVTNDSGYDSCPNGTTISVLIEIVSAKNRVFRSFTASIPYADGVQLGDVLANLTGADGSPVLVRITPKGLSSPSSSGYYCGATLTVGAYATMMDASTNAPIYLPADLAAHR